MTEPIRFYFELEDDADTAIIRSAIESEITNLEGVAESEVVIPNQRMTGVEIAAAIGAGIVIGQSAKQAIDVMAEIVASLTELVRNLKGLKAAVVETPVGPKRLEELTRADIESLLDT